MAMPWGQLPYEESAENLDLEVAEFADKAAADTLHLFDRQTFDDHDVDRTPRKFWPPLSISEFCPAEAENRIEAFLKLWSRGDEWLHFLNLVKVNESEDQDEYIWEAKWSVPTPRHPIPVSTASVFFYFHYSKKKAARCNIEVSYTYEGSQTVYDPNNMLLNENVLLNIIKNKETLQTQISF